MKPDWRKIAYLEMEVYGCVISDEAMVALLLTDDIPLVNVTEMRRRYDLMVAARDARS